MEKYDVISRVYKYLFMDAKLLCLWLHDNLPSVSRDWWFKCVMPALTDDQKVMVRDNFVDNLDELDLAMMVNVGVANWFDISDRNPGQRVKKETLSQMLQVRNHWAHFTAGFPGLDTVVCDMRIIADLHGQLDGKKSDREEMTRFIRDLEKSRITDSVTRQSEETTHQTIGTTLNTGAVAVQFSTNTSDGSVKSIPGTSHVPGPYQLQHTDGYGNFDLSSLRPGLHVYHKDKGSGVIVKWDGKKITVRFADEEDDFNVMSVFVKKASMVVTD